MMDDVADVTAGRSMDGFVGVISCIVLYSE